MADTINPVSAPVSMMKRNSAILLAIATLLLGIGLGYGGGTFHKWWGWTSVETIKEGTGKSADGAHAVLVELEGKLKDGSPFGQKTPFPVPITFEELNEAKMGELVNSIKKMKEGGNYKVTIPARIFNKDKEGPGIPEDSAVIIDIKLVKVLDKAGYDAEAQNLMKKQMEAMGISPENAPGSPAVAPGAGAKEAPADQAPNATPKK